MIKQGFVIGVWARVSILVYTPGKFVVHNIMSDVLLNSRVALDMVV